MKIIVFILGTIIGSFLNVCICRIPLHQSIAYPSSHCGNCNNSLKVYDLIPVISYVVLEGKCRYCKSKISFKYPIIELLTGFLFLFIYKKYGLSFNFFKYIIFTSFMIVIGLIDLETTDVYLKTILSSGIVAIMFIIIEKIYFKYNIKTYIYAILLSIVFIGGIILCTKAMGDGDLDIYIVVALFLGIKFTAITLIFSFIFGSLIGGTLILLNKKSKKDYIAFGPFITMASVFTILFGEKIFSLYMRIF